MSEQVPSINEQEAPEPVAANAEEAALLKDALAKEKALSASYYDQLLRAKAEFENYRKRAEKEKQDARRWGKEEILGPLLSLTDVLEQAEIAAHKASDMKAVVAGLDMINGQFKRLLKDEGLEEIPSAPGDAFNPDWHEAVETVEDAGDEGRVLATFQKGYRFQGALLRPARVKVSTKTASNGGAEKSADA